MRGFLTIGAWACCLCVANFASAAITATGDFAPNPLVPDSYLMVGSNGYGTLRIDAGSTFSSQRFDIGNQDTGFGVVTVTDPGTVWTMTGGRVGAYGYGQLEILNGAVAHSPLSDNTFIGNNSGSYGRLIVDGNGSLLHLESTLHVGESDSNGVVEIRNGGIVNLPTNYLSIGSGGRLALQGGLLRTRQLRNTGLIGGHGEISVSDGALENRGRVEVGAGESLRIGSVFHSAELYNEGELLVDGGKLDVPNGIFNVDGFGSNGGTMSLRNAEVRGIHPIDGQSEWTNRSIINVFGGENHVHGKLRNDMEGEISIVNDSTVFFHDRVRTNFNSTISIFAGSEALFLKELQMDGGTLLTEITGGTSFGKATIVGGASFNGVLQVKLGDGYQPQAGDSFEIMTVTNGIGGFLNLVPESDLPEGLEWALSVGDTNVTLSVVATAPPELAGDYNHDNVVDGADFTVWRNALDSGDLSADGDDSGSVDGNDYDVWKLHYGESLILGSGGLSLAVPEPASVLALGLGALALTALGRARRSRG